MRKTQAHLNLWRALCSALPPIPALSVSEWAEAHRVLSREATAEAGKFSCARVPYQRAAMDDVTDPSVAEIVACWAAQTGKSECLNNVTGYFMHADPASILMVQPTVDLAEAYSKERIAPMIRDTPILQKLVRDPRSRDSGNTLLSKVFPGGNMALIGANAPSGLAGRPRRVILQDEVDRFPTSAGSEGDPCALADKRAESFPNAIKFKTSTPTVRGQSKIWALLEQSDFQKWHCRCPRCDHEQIWMWDQVKWPKDKPEEAWLECANPACAAQLTDAERIQSVRGGRWVATKPFNGIRGRWLNGINTLFKHHRGYRSRLHEFASDFLKAKEGGAQTMRVWINTFLAETYEEGADVIKPEGVAERVETYAPTALPPAALLVTAGADVQKNRIEVEAVAWGAHEERWGIIKEVLWGDTEKAEPWDKLDEFLLREFKRTDGVPLKIERAFVDMQYKPDRVLDFCAPRITRGIYPIQGVNRVGNIVPPLIPPKPSRNNKRRIPHWNIGVTVAKGMIYDRLMLPPGPRAMHFPRGFGYDDDHFKQLTSEVRKTRYSHGQAYSIFEKPNDSVRNEALDIAVYGLAALHSLFPIGWDKLAENRLAQRPAIEASEPTEPQIPAELQQQPSANPAQPRRMPRRGNWVTGGARW